MRTHQKQSQNIQRHRNRPGGGALLTAGELAGKAGEAERTIWTWYRAGVIPGIVLGHRSVRFRESDFLAALEKRKTK
jgi:predicted DNA-binding transcriptional regulator AlpA